MGAEMQLHRKYYVTMSDSGSCSFVVVIGFLVLEVVVELREFIQTI